MSKSNEHKSSSSKNTASTVEKILKESGRIMNTGEGLKEGNRQAEASPEQQAIDAMGDKLQKGGEATVRGGKKLISKMREQDRETINTKKAALVHPQEEKIDEQTNSIDIEEKPLKTSSEAQETPLDNSRHTQPPLPHPSFRQLSEEKDDLHNLPDKNDLKVFRNQELKEITEHLNIQENTPPLKETLHTATPLQTRTDKAQVNDITAKPPEADTPKTSPLPTTLEEQTAEPEPLGYDTGNRDFSQNYKPNLPGRREPISRQRSVNSVSSESKEHSRYDRMSIHTREVDSKLHTSIESPLNTSHSSHAVQSLNNQTPQLVTGAQGGSAALKTMAEQGGQLAGQAVQQAGTSAAAGTASGGVSVAVQVGQKILNKVKETIANAAKSIRENPNKIGGIVACFFAPMLIVVAMAGSFSTASSASNVNLSENVLALMPKIIAACENHGIPEYAPLVAAVMMQESGGNVELVNGDVMMCAEAMGYPVFTPVPVDESIDYGTGLIANLLRQAGAQGPDDLPNIKLALQSYNYGPGYMSWVKSNHGGVYSKENAIEFANMMAAQMGWSGYGDEEYVEHVLRYYQLSSFGFLTGDSTIENGFFAYPCGDYTWDTYSGHEGIDISWGNCYGEPVYAVADGAVTYTHDGWTPSEGYSGIGSYGNTVWITHSNGWQSRYGHMSSVVVESGTYVTQGQLLGYIGSTGNSSGPHLHLALYNPSGNPFSGGRNWAEVAWPQHKG